ncbi:MAG TPA: hypothetical protein VGD45_27550 [Steroidobacter sp.]|uniref:SMP-30/gluconolactonase/LRE family protein n=1 Tax=Steroidobacter sp. TaxID=1978227 RepID=UPI002ED86CEE
MSQSRSSLLVIVFVIFPAAVGTTNSQAGTPVALTRPAVQEFAKLPDGIRYPEGITADPETGNIYVGTFDARTQESARRNEVLRYSPQGKLLARRRFHATPLTGLAFREGKLYILNFGAAKLQRLAANFDASTPIEDVATFQTLTPHAPSPRHVTNFDGSEDVVAFGSKGQPAPNGMVFDRSGNLYVSDSFQGAVLRIADATHCVSCVIVPISRDPLLATTGTPPFGANGLALNEAETVLFITNAGDGRLLKLPIAGGSVSVVAESLAGADGLLFHGGLLWVAANQADSVVALTEQGRIVVRAGEFDGIASDGSPRGLLFPASTVAQGNWMFVTNLALPLTPPAGDEWEEDITRWTISRFPLPALTTKELP